MNHPSREFDEAVSACCHGTATDDQMRELATLLRSHEAARDAWIVAVELHARLACEHGLFVARPSPAIDAAESLDASKSSRGATRPETEVAATTKARQTAEEQISVRRKKFVPMAVAGGILLATVVLIASLNWRPFANESLRSGDAVAVQVLKVRDAASNDWRIGQRVALKQLHFAAGTVELRLEQSGVTLRISGPADVTLRDPMLVRVARGQVTADVGEQGKGFVIETTQARVVDLGTRFGIDASDSAHTDVVVFKGQVELYQAGAKERVALLNQGEALRVESHRRTSRIVSVAGAEDASGWTTTGRPSGESLVASVRDSMSTDEEGAKKWPSLRSFYRIVPGGLRDGALAFSDQTDCWNDVPQELVGADQVRTFAVDSLNWWMVLTVELSRPSELFVFVDQRNPAPNWVRERFADTGKTLTLDVKSSQRSGQVLKQLPFSIWRCAVEKPGAVALGPPYENPPADRKSFSPNRMFGVAVKGGKR